MNLRAFYTREEWAASEAELARLEHENPHGLTVADLTRFLRDHGGPARQRMIAGTKVPRRDRPRKAD